LFRFVSSWDEWVPCPRVLKFNEENLKKQKELLMTHGNTRAATRLNKSVRKSAVNAPVDTEKTSATVELEKSTPEANKNKVEEARDTRKRRTRNESTKEVSYYSPKCEIAIAIPDELNQILADDWHLISIQNKLITTPAAKTVEDILNDYLTEKIDNQADKSIADELINGTKDYFDTVLQTKLLYKFEKLQYTELMKNSKYENKKLSQIYGFMHFLRLFVKIGELLACNSWDELGVKQLQFHINDILRFLKDNKIKYFSAKDYYNPTATYIQKA